MAPPPESSTPPVPDTENNLLVPPSSSKEQERLNRLQQDGRKRLVKGTGLLKGAVGLVDVNWRPGYSDCGGFEPC